MAKKFVMTPEDAIVMAYNVDFLKEKWEFEQYASALYAAYLWSKNAK